jgi:two-component system nitrogen regulation response regulator NtrX
MPSILIVDDEPGVRSALGGVLRDEGYNVDAVDSGEACLERLGRRVFDVVVLDIWLPGMDGLATLARMRERQVDAQVVIISGHGNVESAVRAIKMGAFDFVEKPLSLEKTVLVVRNALRQRHLEAENLALRAKVDAQHTMVGESSGMMRLREQVAMAAPTNGRVLIFGENGTGKELVARNIHALSLRRTGPFVEVNCAAIPEELIESELFGHVRGAFTGAVADRRGKFELAHGGTIFLDEIGDMSLKTQAKVLRVLQEQVMEAVGGSTRIKVDARVLAATNKDLLAEIKAGRFREDLYFRLNVVPISVPALRERRDDISLLADHFMAMLAREYGRRAKRFDADAQEALQRYAWPGNVRELRNVIERLMIMVPGERVAARDMLFLDQGAGLLPALEASTAPIMPLHDARDDFERQYILRALAAQQGNISRTADVLGVERSNMYRKMRSFGIAPRRAEEDAEA